MDEILKEELIQEEIKEIPKEKDRVKIQFTVAKKTADKLDEMVDVKGFSRTIITSLAIDEYYKNFKKGEKL